MDKTALKQQPNETNRPWPISSVTIKNFRGFVDTKLNDFRRVNLLVGDNGVGKTSFLEGLFAVASETADRLLNLRSGRGLPIGVREGMNDAASAVWDQFWSHLFHDNDITNDIVISVAAPVNSTRTLRIYRSPERKLTTVSMDNGQEARKVIPSPISVKWNEGTEQAETLSPVLDGVNLGFFAAKHPTTVKGRFIRPDLILKPEIEKFSEIRRAGDEATILKEIQKQFPYIVELSVESEYGHNVIYAKTEWQKNRIPINLLSDGLIKIFNTLLNIITLEGGVLFIDELDNGIFFQRQEMFWRQIVETSNTYNTQLFVSAHSREFLDAMLPVMRQFPNDFSVIQVFREEGVSKAGIASGPGVINMIESGIEIRV